MKRAVAFCFVVLALFGVRPALAQFQISNADNTMSIKFGLLGQLQGEALDSATTDDRDQVQLQMQVFVF
jgi:hypothetical protein